MFALNILLKIQATVPQIHKQMFSFIIICLFSQSGFSASIASQRLLIPEFQQGTLGEHAQYFQETDKRLTLEEASAHFKTSDVKTGSNHSIALGLGADPVWIKISIINSAKLAQTYRLAVETPWLDYIDTWIVKDAQVIKQISGGDGIPFNLRPLPYRFYAFEFPYSSGSTDLFIRIESKGPMAIPIRFSTLEQSVKHEISNAYQYGLLYGLMLALALYNLVLFVFIRQRQYGLYSLYLIGFLLNSLSYTGQLHTIITYDFGPYFQDWLDIFLMITYSIAGLHFARALLQTFDYAPKLDRFVVGITLFIPTGMVFGFIIDNLMFSMILSFLLNSCFVVLFIVMGVKAIKANKPFAYVFLFSSVSAALCITISTLAVLGILVPYNDFTFKAIEIGMSIEAVFLSIILARQFRMAHLDKVIAESYARTDILTQLNNRRGFQDITGPIWQHMIREQRNVSIVLIDVDYFKAINDEHGHDAGDKVLKIIAQCISNTCRKSDICARWGGEEFIIFLPETDQSHALEQAERIRLAIETLSIPIQGKYISITASFGVAGTIANIFNRQRLKYNSLEPIISEADSALYLAKSNGKNQVKHTL